MKKPIVLTIAALVVVTFLLLATRAGQAQDIPNQIQRVEAVEANESDFIPVQGQLTNASGNPLNVTYSMTFRLYDSYSGGTALCSATSSVTVNDGLFYTYMAAPDCPIDGRQLYLGIQVGSDPEMTPRQYIDNVPYAWSVRPGALIKDNRPTYILQAENEGAGPALSGKNTDADPNGIGVSGTSLAGPGVKGDSLVSVGVEASSFSGVSLAATGTGVIQSSADSYVWISGNGVRPFYQTDSTIINMTSIGSARVTRGATTGAKNVILPITLPGKLYGQNVTVTGLDIYWAGDTDFDAMTAVLLRRQTGVCSSCYQSILFDSVDRTCEDSANPTGCTTHYNLTTNNQLTNTSGILYLTIEMTFSGASTWIDIGGARLTLAHD